MKNKILLVAFMLILTNSFLFAQSLKLGIKAGTDIHKIDGKAISDQFTYGFDVGGFLQVGINKKWGIQPEVLFSQVNVDTSSTFSSVYDFKSISNVQLRYLKIPLMLNYNANKFVTLQAGPQFGVLLDQNSNLLENGKSAFSKGDFSLAGGLQLNISRIRIYGRYVVGLNNINENDSQDKWKNQSVQLGIGFAIL